MLITTAEGAVCAFSPAPPKEMDERVQAVRLPHVQPPAPGPCPIVCDKGFARAGVEKAAAELGHALIRPPRAGEHDPPVGGVPRPAAPAHRGAQRRDLAQVAHRRSGRALPDRL
ncbi:hypothetical protein ACFVH6_30155 [Spirillospora sp. NPDC127200]